MRSQIRKFFQLCKTKGVFFASYKILSYLRFFIIRNRLEGVWGKVFIKSGKLGLKGWNTGPRLFCEGLEITKGAGIVASIFAEGKWHDSSKALWKAEDVSQKKLVFANKWCSLPIRQKWIVRCKENNKLSLDVKIELDKDTNFVEQKISVILPEEFDFCFDDSGRQVKFLSFSEYWGDLKGLSEKSNSIGASSECSMTPFLFIMKNKNYERKVFIQAQNSDFKDRVRFLNFVISSRSGCLDYKKGVNDFFNLELELK